MTINFRDDPHSLITQLDAAWREYEDHFEQRVEQALGSIVSWRFATDDMFPSHPLFGQADTTAEAEPWSPFTRHWLRNDDELVRENRAWRHGYDKDGRVLLSRNNIWGHMSFWNEDYCDRLWFHESTEVEGQLIWRLPHQDRVEFSRYWYDSEGRIDCTCCYLREGDTHYRQFEWFAFEVDQCVESIQQSFEIMSEIPSYQEDCSESELRQDYRPLEGEALLNNLVETMFSRRRVIYSYSDDGELVRAEEFRPNGEPIEELLFEKLPSRPLEETIDCLVEETSNAIVKVVKKRSKIKPYRGLILVYSAEHAHCGLPHEVRILDHETQWPANRYDQEAYTDQLDVAFKRPITKLLTEYNHRCNGRFSIDDFEAATTLTVSVVRRIAEQLHSELTGTKHVTSDFAVLAIDDHGDVDGMGVT